MRAAELLVVILVIALSSAPAAAQEPTAIADSTEVLEANQAARVPGLRGRPDLLQHASLSFALGLGVGIVTEEPAAAAGVSLSFGIAKEVADPRFDKTDLLADLVGAALADRKSTRLNSSHLGISYA